MTRWPNALSNSDLNDPVYTRHGGVVASTQSALKLKIQGSEIWIPRTAIVRYNNEVIILDPAFASRAGIASEW